MKVFGWLGDYSGCGWYRILIPAAELRSRGHEYGHDVKRGDAWLDADVIVGQRISQPGPTRLWLEMRDAGKRLIYDLDDDLLALDTSNPAAGYFALATVRRNIERCAAAADVVTCATPHLAAMMSGLNPNTVVVPNALPSRMLDWRVPARTDGIVTIGWGGTPSTAPDFSEHAGHFRRVLEREPSAELHAMGVHPHDIKPGIGDRVRVTGFDPSPEGFLRRIDWHIATAPYRDTPFNRAKVPTKALEAAFLGLPIVASDTLPYRGFIHHGETGLIASSTWEWPKHLTALVRDEQMRRDLGAAAREQAKQHTIEAVAPLWEEVLAP